MDFQNYNYSSELSTVDVASISNLDGLYNNGPTNNGIKATLTLNSLSPIVVDGVTLKQSMSVLLKDQLLPNENGIYVCIEEGSAFSNPILQRRDDFQCIEQVKGGQYFTISKGSINIGKIFVIIDPIPLEFGIDPLVVISDQGSSNVYISNSTTPSGGVGNEVYASTSEFIQEVPIVGDTNERIGAILGRLRLNGSTSTLPGYAAGVTGDIRLDSGTYNNGVLAGVLGTLNMAGTTGPTTVNGMEIYGVATRLGSYPNNPVNIENVIGFGLLIFSGQIIGTCARFVGRANKFFEFDGATTSYFVTAGSGAGSAGDPTKCNADNVLVCSFDEVPCYIPLFNSNA